MSAPLRSIPEWTLPQELVALNRIVTELNSLGGAERRRVLNYLNDRYGYTSKQEEEDPR